MLRPSTASTALVRAVLVAAVVAACGTTAAAPATPIFRTDRVADCPPDDCGPGYSVAARSSADDGAVLAVNVLVASEAGRMDIEAIAAGFRSRHERSRVIVSFFDEGAGAERFELGSVPSGGEPFHPPRGAQSWLATIDLGRDDEGVTHWWRPGGERITPPSGGYRDGGAPV